MATTEITETAFQTAVAECADAIIAGGWATAKTKYAVAEAINTGLLQRFTSGSVDKTRRDSLNGLRKAIDYAEGRSTAVADNRRLISTQMGFSNQR